MNLHALKIFKAVADFESVTKAAEHLRLSQPAVTIQIRHLEKELGVSLVQSKGRGIELTTIGQVLAMEAEKIFSLEAMIEKKIADVKNAEAEKIIIASTYLPATFLLPAPIARYKAQYDHAQIILQTGNSTEMIQQLLTYKADIGIIVSEYIHEPNIKSHHWQNIEFYFVTHPHHPLANKQVDLQQVVQYPFVLREKGSSTRDILEALCMTNCVPPPKEGLIFKGLIESIHAILAGYGVMLAPCIAVEPYITSGQLTRIHIHNLQIMRPVYICMRSDAHATPHQEAFVHSLLEYKKAAH